MGIVVKIVNPLLAKRFLLCFCGKHLLGLFFFGGNALIFEVVWCLRHLPQTRTCESNRLRTYVCSQNVAVLSPQLWWRKSIPSWRWVLALKILCLLTLFVLHTSRSCISLARYQSSRFYNSSNDDWLGGTWVQDDCSSMDYGRKDSFFFSVGHHLF